MLTAHMLYSSSCFESYVLIFVSVCFYTISFPSFCSCVFSLLFSLFVQLFSSCFFFSLPPKELSPTRSIKTVSFMRLRSKQYLPGRSHFPAGEGNCIVRHISWALTNGVKCFLAARKSMCCLQEYGSCHNSSIDDTHVSC